MKIGFVIDDTLDKPDGVQQYVLTLGKWLGDQGHEVHYLAGASKRQDVGRVHSLSKNVKVTFNGNRLSIPLPANSKMLRQLLEHEQYDILHVQMPYSPMLAHKVINLAPPSTAVVGTFHILPQTRLVKLATHALGIWTRRSLRRFDSVYAVSPAAKEFATAAFRLHDVEVLPNVVDLQAFKTAKPFERYRDEVPTIMFLGRLVPRKGCAWLLKAMAEYTRRFPDRPFRLVICGKGPLESQLKQLAEHLDLKDQTEFTGFVSEEDKPRYIASADIAAFPSTGGESFGIVLIEAMATGRPLVLAGDNPGYRSVMFEQPELLWRPQDYRALAQKLDTLLQDQARRRQLIDWQIGHVRQFDIETVGPRLLADYQAALTKTSRRRHLHNG